MKSGGFDEVGIFTTWISCTNILTYTHQKKLIPFQVIFKLKIPFLQ
jgi:hypothetical protein